MLAPLAVGNLVKRLWVDWVGVRSCNGLEPDLLELQGSRTKRSGDEAGWMGRARAGLCVQGEHKSERETEAERQARGQAVWPHPHPGVSTALKPPLVLNSGSTPSAAGLRENSSTSLSVRFLICEMGTGPPGGLDLTV